MKYLEKIHMETLLSPSVQVWLGNELESRGIDSMIYSRHIIQLLQQDEIEEIDSQEYFEFNKYKPIVKKKGKSKSTKKSLDKSEDRKKSAAIECLQAVSEEDSGIEVLVEELCTKLKEVCSTENVEDNEVLKISDSSGSNDDTDTTNSSPEMEDPAERYYAAFPALQSQENTECSEFSSPYNQNSVDVWKKNPITKTMNESFCTNIDSGNESEKDTLQNGNSKDKETNRETRAGKTNKKKKNLTNSKHQVKITERHHRNAARLNRFSSWPQDKCFSQDANVDSQQEFSSEKERELCSQVENLLKGILLPGCQQNDNGLDFHRKLGRSIHKTAPPSLSEERSSPELEEKDFWYTQPLEELLTTEQYVPFHQRLYKRHSYPSFECFNGSDREDFISTMSSPSEKFWGDGHAGHQNIDGNNVSSEDYTADEDSFGLQNLNMEKENDVSCNDDSFGLQSLMMEQEYFENLSEDRQKHPHNKLDPSEEEHDKSGDTSQNHSYFLSSSPWTATEQDFKGNHTTLNQKTQDQENDKYSLCPRSFLVLQDESLTEVNSGYKDNDDSSGDENLFHFSFSTLFDSLSKSSRNQDSTTSSNSSASVATMTEHGFDGSLLSFNHNDEKLSVPENSIFPHTHASIYCTLHAGNLLSPTSETSPVSSCTARQATCWPNKVLFGENAFIEEENSVVGSEIGSSSQLSQLWNVNYQGKKINGGLAYPWKSYQHFDQIWEDTTDENDMQNETEDSSLNTLIPQITLSLFSEENVFPCRESVEEKLDSQVFSGGTITDFERSVSLNELSSLKQNTNLVTSNPQLSKSFELVPSEHSAFQGVVPKRIYHVMSEPNLNQYHQKNADNSAMFLEECLLETPEKKNVTDFTITKENLYFSPKTHFQPIQSPVDPAEDAASDTSSSDFHLRDLFGGYQTSKTPYQKFQDFGSDSEESFIPMFKLRKEHDKYIQTNNPEANHLAEDGCAVLNNFPNICNKCGNLLNVESTERLDTAECLCVEVCQIGLEDFDIHGYIDSLTASEQNTPQNVPEEVKNACTDSGYEDFDTGDTNEISRQGGYTASEMQIPQGNRVPVEHLFECITVEKSSGEKEVFSREDGWVMYKVEGGLGLSCLNEAHIRKNLKYAMSTDENKDPEDGGEFQMHQVEQEWLLNGYCEGELFDDSDNLDYPVASMWSTGIDKMHSSNQLYSEKETLREPFIELSSNVDYETSPYVSFSEMNFQMEDNSFGANASVTVESDNGSFKDSNNFYKHKNHESSFPVRQYFQSVQVENVNRGLSPAGKDASLSEENGKDDSVIKVKLVFHKRKPAPAELQENVDPQVFMPMPSQALFSTDLEEEWMKSLNDEKSSKQFSSASIKGLAAKKKPCSFFMDGSCRRVDCKFAHDVSNITCRFWEEGDCFKGEMCPFLHGYYPRDVDCPPVCKPKCVKFEYQPDDFPDLAKEPEGKAKLAHPKKIPYFDPKVSRKINRRAQAKGNDRGPSSTQKSQGEMKYAAKSNIKSSVYCRKSSTSSANHKAKQ